MTIDAQKLLMVITVGDAAACVVALSDRTNAIGFLIASIVGAYAVVSSPRVLKSWLRSRLRSMAIRQTV